MLLNIILIVNAITVFSIVFLEQKKPLDGLAWVLVVTLLPGLGMLLYLVFGSTIRIKIMYHIRQRDLTHDLDIIMQKADTVGECQLNSLDEVQQTNASFNHRYNHCQTVVYNSVDIITRGKEKYDRLFRDIKEARNSINILYYGFHNDRIGNQLVDLLTEKAMEGVSVRLLIDGIGSFFTPKKMFSALRMAGGKVCKIKPSLTHFRNHRKIVVIDGLIGYTGGMNIGNKYLGGFRNKSPWRDTQLRIKGDAVYSLQYLFYYDLYFVDSKEKIDKIELKTAFPGHDVEEHLPCQVVGGGIETDRQVIKMTYVKLINSAKKSIILQTPYFIPDDAVFSALQLALASGVEVLLMIPAQRSGLFLEAATFYYIDLLLPFGLKVYRYNGYLHAKTITVDESVTLIGTANMDVRSLELDDEVCVVFYNEAFTKKHLEIIRNDIHLSERLDIEAFQSRPLHVRMKEKFVKLFSPLL